jgi:hypothetical protein
MMILPELFKATGWPFRMFDEYVERIPSVSATALSKPVGWKEGRRPNGAFVEDISNS